MTANLVSKELPCTIEKKWNILGQVLSNLALILIIINTASAQAFDSNKDRTKLVLLKGETPTERQGEVSQSSTLINQTYPWHKLDTVPYRGKQDDIFFINPEIGWYVNGAGKIYKTIDGGQTWVEKLNQPGTYFRCIGFIDSMKGFAGNIGTDYFPDVTDTTPLYETKDGGETWKAVTNIPLPTIKGLCAIDIVKKPFINAGNLDYKSCIYAAGRVGGPAYLIKSVNGGESWETIDMGKYCAMILDIKFFTPDKGIICAATDADVEKSEALILITDDGGKHWSKKYRSKRKFELIWKCSFPNEKTGYATVQSYNPDTKISQRYFIKTTNGGKKWQELKLVDNFEFREFGVGFIDEKTGWIGGSNTSYETRDGGKTWLSVDMGKAVNKIRLLKSGNGFVGYSIGVNVYKLDQSQQ